MTEPKDSEIKIRISEEDKHKITERMNQLSILNMSAYLRKMAVDGVIVKLNLPEITELNSLLRRYNNNVNQIAKRVNSTGSIYQNEIEEIKNNQGVIFSTLNDILSKLSKLN